jgi:hypothetical protein
MRVRVKALDSRDLIRHGLAIRWTQTTQDKRKKFRHIVLVPLPGTDNPSLSRTHSSGEDLYEATRKG